MQLEHQERADTAVHPMCSLSHSCARLSREVHVRPALQQLRTARGAAGLDGLVQRRGVAAVPRVHVRARSQHQLHARRAAAARRQDERGGRLGAGARGGGGFGVELLWEPPSARLEEGPGVLREAFEESDVDRILAGLADRVTDTGGGDNNGCSAFAFGESAVPAVRSK